jgi:integrase
MELDDGKLSINGVFNASRYQEILEDYNLRPNLRLVKGEGSDSKQVTHKPELSIMEIWDIYVEHIKKPLKRSYIEEFLNGYCPKTIKSAIEATKSENAFNIRKWLIDNRNNESNKRLLSHLDKAHELAIRRELITRNPFKGFAEELGNKKGDTGKEQHDIDENLGLEDKTKAYSWEEMQIILDYFKSTNLGHWYNFYKFKFLTGCRTGEAIGLRWKDVHFDKECIVIAHTYNETTKAFYTPKNGKERIFPMRTDSELWKLLKSIPQCDPSHVVFKSKKGRIITQSMAFIAWGGSEKTIGAIPTLIQQGKLKQKLSPYNTRHSFISHHIYVIGTPPEIVNIWCDHSEDVSKKHYRDIGDRAMNYNPDLTANQQAITKNETTQDAMAEELAMLRAKIAELESKQNN